MHLCTRTIISGRIDGGSDSDRSRAGIRGSLWTNSPQSWKTSLCIDGFIGPISKPACPSRFISRLFVRLTTTPAEFRFSATTSLAWMISSPTSSQQTQRLLRGPDRREGFAPVGFDRCARARPGWPTWPCSHPGVELESISGRQTAPKTSPIGTSEIGQCRDHASTELIQDKPRRSTRVGSFLFVRHTEIRVSLRHIRKLLEALGQ
jgi:hypothetical protein